MNSIPPYSDSRQWITAYLTTHSLSAPSRRYSFLLWLAVIFIVLAFAVLHWTGSSGGPWGAVWLKWALRRRTWRKKHTLAVARQTNRPHRQPVSLPPNAQLLSLTVLTLASFALVFIGPDYLDPSLKVWQIHARSPSPSQLYDTSTFVPYMPQHTISKSLWSSSARAGQIAFALLPLCVLFGLKAPPFAIFAIHFMIQLYFDKLAWLHRWAGRLIWYLTFIHVVLWSIQLGRDVNPSTGRVAYVYAWSYTPFVYGWIAFVLLTLIILLSLHPIRRRFYEYFYILHVLLVPCMLVFAGLHHPAVAWWCWVALALWIGERCWRGIWWVYVNGSFGEATPVLSPIPSNLTSPPLDTWETGHVHRLSVESTHLRYREARSPSPLDGYYRSDHEIASVDHDIFTSKDRLPASPPHSAEQYPPRTSISRRQFPYIPPPGYVHAELLSGRTVRLRFITPGFLSWSPGQHFLLNIPSVSRLTSHPFTCASVCDEEAQSDAGRVMLFLVRTKGGWTQDLWNLVSRMTAEQYGGDVFRASASNDLPENGVLLRAYVDGPFGSAKRARWGNYSTGVIVAGGSGVSFGLSLLHYMCMCLAGRDGRRLGGQPGGWGWKGAELKRVRFIWLVREYSHIQWCASIIRRCMATIPSPALQVDIYVTNFKPVPLRQPTALVPPRAYFDGEFMKSDEALQPPHAKFAHEDLAHQRSGSPDSTESLEAHGSDVDLSYYLGESLEDVPPADEVHIVHEANMLDLTNFDGDVEMRSRGEVNLSRRLKKEGKLRRLSTHKLSTMKGMNQGARSSHPLANGEARTPQRAQEPRHPYPDHDRTRLKPSRGHRQQASTSSTQSTKRLLPASDSGRPSSVLSSTGLYSSLSHSSEMTVVPQSTSFSSNASSVTIHDDSTPATKSYHYHDIRSESGHTHSHELQSTRPPTSTPDASDAQLLFKMDKQEADDVNTVSEYARPGKPKLDKVIADEVQASKGAIVVACCGPTSLNAMVRKIVAAQIDPGRIRRGDMRGSIALVCEEFEY